MYNIIYWALSYFARAVKIRCLSGGDKNGIRLENARVEVSEVWKGVLVHILREGKEPHVQVRREARAAAGIAF